MVEHILQFDQREHDDLPQSRLGHGPLSNSSSSEKVTAASFTGHSYIGDEKQPYLDVENASKLNSAISLCSDPVRVNSERIVTTGKDVSCFVVDLRDDGDQSLTFRSFFLGTVFAGLGAALCQVHF